MAPKNIFRCVTYNLPAIFKHKRLKLIPNAHVHFSPEFNILCECEFDSSKKNLNPYIPWFPPKNPYLPYTNFCGSETPN